MLTDHIHPYAPARNVRHLRSRAETRFEDEFVDLAIGQLRLSGYQRSFDRFGEDFLPAQTAPVIGEFDDNLAREMLRFKQKIACGRFPCGFTFFRYLEAVV